MHQTLITALLTFGILALSPAVQALDHLDAAAARYEWRWFGRTLAGAQEQARAAGVTVVVIQRGDEMVVPDWVPVADQVGVTLHGERILLARYGADGALEGCADPTQLPWLGLDEAAAVAAAKAASRSLRVVVRDGMHLPVTMDYREDRLNVQLLAGVVVAVYGG